MLNEMMIYARGLAEWPKDVFKDIGHNNYRGSGRKGMKNYRKKKPNMNHVSRATKLKHRRSK